MCTCAHLQAKHVSTPITQLLMQRSNVALEGVEMGPMLGKGSYGRVFKVGICRCLATQYRCHSIHPASTLFL